MARAVGRRLSDEQWEAEQLRNDQLFHDLDAGKAVSLLKDWMVDGVPLGECTLPNIQTALKRCEEQAASLQKRRAALAI